MKPEKAIERLEGIIEVKQIIARVCVDNIAMLKAGNLKEKQKKELAEALEDMEALRVAIEVLRRQKM